MDTRHLRTAALTVTCLCMAPLLTAADCSGALGGQPHHGDWIDDDPGGVTFYRFDSNGEMIYTTEIYSSSKLKDDIKLEIQATCTRPEGYEPEADGTYTLHCVNERSTRASHRMGAKINATKALGEALGTRRTRDRTIEVRRDGERMVVTRLPNTSHGHPNTHTFESTDRALADSFLDRFREGTTLITEPTVTTRQKDLP